MRLRHELFRDQNSQTHRFYQLQETREFPLGRLIWFRFEDRFQVTELKMLDAVEQILEPGLPSCTLAVFTDKTVYIMR